MRNNNTGVTEEEAVNNDRSRRIACLIQKLEGRQEYPVQEELQKKLQLKLWLAALKSRTNCSTKKSIIFEEDGISAPSLTVQNSIIAARLVQKHGVVMLRNCEGSSDIGSKHLVLVMTRLATLLEEIARQNLKAEGLKTREIVCRNTGRFDIIFEDEEIEVLGRCGFWLKTVRTVLGPNCYLLKRGALIALPGAHLQSAHSDGKHLFDDDMNVIGHLPAHCLTVFVPLCDLSTELGPTEFYPDTHSGNNSQLASDAMRGRAPAVTFAHAKAFQDAIIFDYRIVHRGLANTNRSESRPMLYFTYAKSWFRDTTNYSTLSLYDE